MPPAPLACRWRPAAVPAVEVSAATSAAPPAAVPSAAATAAEDQLRAELRASRVVAEALRSEVEGLLAALTAKEEEAVELRSIAATLTLENAELRNTIVAQALGPAASSESSQAETAAAAVAAAAAAPTSAPLPSGARAYETSTPRAVLIKLGLDPLTGEAKTACPTEVDFEEHGLTSVPVEIFEASRAASIQQLDLRGNALGALPEEIGALTMLKLLICDDNQLVTLPAGIGALRGLKLLACNSNLLETLPETIGDLVSLEALELNGNAISTLPAGIVNLTALETLDLEENPLKRPQSAAVEQWLANLREGGCDVLLDEDATPR